MVRWCNEVRVEKQEGKTDEDSCRKPMRKVVREVKLQNAAGMEGKMESVTKSSFKETGKADMEEIREDEKSKLTRDRRCSNPSGKAVIKVLGRDKVERKARVERDEGK